MEKHGNAKAQRPQGKRTIFRDDDEVMEMGCNEEEKQGRNSSQEMHVKKKKDYHKDAKLKSWRLIIRNLPFKATREDLESACSQFGTITDIVLPPSKTMPGRAAGFAFVQFKARNSAEEARQWFNNNKIKDRLVAADWALPKDTYETAAQEERKQLEKKVKSENERKVEQPVLSSSTLMNRKRLHVRLPQESTSESMTRSEDEVEMSDLELSENSDNENEASDGDKEEGKSYEDDDEGERGAKDVAIEQKRVVFLRNLSFDTTNDALKAEMAKFGKVVLAICCKFRDSGHTKGTAFVHFATQDGAKACLEAVENGLNIDGRNLKGSYAIQREAAAEILRNKGVKVPEDRRNLRLIRFSLIREGTSAAKGMSTEDAAKRQRLAEQSKKKLENLHMFVSPTRLMIHNLPSSMTDDKLRQLCQEVAGSLATITECRIWRDPSKLDAQGNPRSKGFAFVNFSEHKDALLCLQKLNNNPRTFTDKRRPIVEFSIENLLAIRAKARRAAHCKGENLTGRELTERVKQQVRQSIEEVHGAGMKVMPKFLGKKLRHKNMSKTQLKKKNLSRKKVRKPGFPPSDMGVLKAKTKEKNKKQMTKFLALSS